VIRFEHIGPEDWRLWREVRLRALAEAPNAFCSSLSDWQGSGDTEQRWRERLGDVALNVVAVKDDRGVGQVSGTRTDDEDEVELISMWVAPDVRGTGIGDSLVEEVVRWAHRMGVRAVRLAVMKANPEAIALYRRHDFRLTKELSATQLKMVLSVEFTSESS